MKMTEIGPRRGEASLAFPLGPANDFIDIITDDNYRTVKAERIESYQDVFFLKQLHKYVQVTVSCTLLHVCEAASGPAPVLARVIVGWHDCGKLIQNQYCTYVK